MAYIVMAWIRQVDSVPGDVASLAGRLDGLAAVQDALRGQLDALGKRDVGAAVVERVGNAERRVRDVERP